MSADIGIAVSVEVTVSKKRDLFLARCAALNVVSQGPSASQAVEQLGKELRFLVATCLADGSLDALLMKRLAAPKQAEFAVENSSHARVYVDLPPTTPVEILKRFRDAAASAA